MTLDISRIRALCFDIDGTLSDTDDQFVLRLARLLHPIRFIFPQNDHFTIARKIVMATERPGNLLLQIPDRLGIDEEIASFSDFIYRQGLQRSADPFLLIPGVKECLVKLKRQFPLSIVSARGQRTTRFFLEQFNLSPLFDCVASAQTCRYTKPFPDPIILAAEKMNVPPQSCLMIGDTTIDIQAGKAAGSQTVGVLCGFGKKEELQNAGADLILKSTPMIAGILTGE